MTTPTGFLSIENKGLLWNVLYENNAFDGIPKDQVSSIQNLFEKSLHAANTDGKDLIILNKDFISGFIHKIDSLKQRSSVVSNNRKEEVNSQFTNRQQELSTLLNPQPPKGIDFADADDMPLDKSKIDSMLQATIRQRELDVELPSTDTNATGQHKWLSGENAMIDNSMKQIRIGDEITDNNTAAKLDIKSKKVAWADEDSLAVTIESANMQDNFFQKLKPKQTGEGNFVGQEEFSRLSDKIDKIYSLLEDLVKAKDEMHRDV